MKKSYIIKFEVVRTWWYFEYRVKITDCNDVVLFLSKEVFSSRLNAYKLITKIKENAYNAPINFLIDN